MEDFPLLDEVMEVVGGSHRLQDRMGLSFESSNASVANNVVRRKDKKLEEAVAWYFEEKAKAYPATTSERRKKLGERMGIRFTPVSPSRKRWDTKGACVSDPCSAVANALSNPAWGVRSARMNTQRIDGGPHKREEPLPGIDMPRILLKERGAFGNADTGVHGCRQLRATAGDKPRKVEDDVKVIIAPLNALGDTRADNGRDKGVAIPRMGDGTISTPN
ncbi:hypothetical protein CTI12_AA536030 [Artemisia annua]|uniref:Uncharacterized protein n=1 Tax=Artemisia annua TaxID=35608 RepID=A0A2U1L332_ARTAN|nr:hypothetical protein CTI12_AA536030 [Artemisia annua]